MEISKFKHNIISLGMLQAANYIIPLATSLYLIKTVGPERFGLIAFSLAIVSYFVILTDFGFNFSGVRQVSITRENRAQVSEIYSSITYVKIGLTLLSFLVLSLLTVFVERMAKDGGIYFVTFGIVVGQVLMPTWLFQGLEEMRFISLLNIVGKAISAVLIFVLVHTPSDYLYVPGINSVVSIIMGVIALTRVRLHCKVELKSPKLKDIIYQVKVSSTLFLANVSSSLYTITTVFILGMFAGNEAVGIFSAADKVIQAAKGIFYPVTQAMYPISSKKFHTNPADGVQFAAKIGIPLTGTMFVVSTIIFLSSSFLVSILYGEKYRTAADILQIMAFLPAIICASNFLGVQILLNVGKQIVFRNILAIAAICSVIMCTLLVSNLGARGAAISVLMVEILITALMFYSASGVVQKIKQNEYCN